MVQTVIKWVRKDMDIIVLPFANFKHPQRHGHLSMASDYHLLGFSRWRLTPQVQKLPKQKAAAKSRNILHTRTAL